MTDGLSEIQLMRKCLTQSITLVMLPAMMFPHNHGELDPASVTNFAILPFRRRFSDEHSVRFLQNRERVPLVLHQVVSVHDGLIIEYFQ